MNQLADRLGTPEQAILGDRIAVPAIRIAETLALRERLHERV